MLRATSDNRAYLATPLRGFAQISFTLFRKLQIRSNRHIKFRTRPCEKLLNANILGESDAVKLSLRNLPFQNRSQR